MTVVGFYRDELLNREVFYTLLEAKTLIENWREEYNHVRLHTPWDIGLRLPRPSFPPIPRLWA